MVSYLNTKDAEELAEPNNSNNSSDNCEVECFRL